MFDKTNNPDVLFNVDPSPALAIVKEFFKPTTILGKELVLYKALTSKKLKNEGKINYLVDSVLRERKKLNYSEMRRAKYNLVKKITEKYELKDFLEQEFQIIKILLLFINYSKFNKTPTPKKQKYDLSLWKILKKKIFLNLINNL